METHKELDDLYHSNYSTGSFHKGRSNIKTHGNKDEFSEFSKSRKKESNKSGNRQKPNNTQSSYSGGRVSSPNESFMSSRYYYREVPPRFQTHKYSSNKGTNKSSQSTKTTTSTQGNKKPSKDSSSNRWPSHSSTDKWPTSPDSEITKSSQSTKGRGENENITQSNWNNTQSMSDDDSLSDPIAENDIDGFSSSGSAKVNEKKGASQDPASDWEEVYECNPQPSSYSESLKLKKDQADGTDIRHSPNNESPEGDASVDGPWRSRNSIGSTSSVNSVGSNSSWKGNSTRLANSYQRSSSPRKQGRYENHRSISVSSSSSRTSTRYTSKKKPVIDLDDAIENLQCEPSGWGDLPSPKQSNIDTGTEVWGIPDDVKQKMKKDHKNAPVSNWSDCKSKSTPDHWGDDGTMVAGWNHGGDDITEGLQWDGTSETGWNIVVSKGKNRSNFADKLKLLVDMGFSPSASEKALKMNNDNLEATVGDLLALSALKDEDHHDTTSFNYLPLTTSSSSLCVQKQPSFPSTSPSGHVTPPLSLPITSSVNIKENTYLSTPSSTGTPNGTGPQVYQGQQWQQQQHRVSPNSPATGLNLPNLQHELTLQLNQCQLLKQRLTMQMKSNSTLPSPQFQKQQQFLTANLNQVNNKIIAINKQMMAVNQLMQQQKQPMVMDEKDGKETRSDNYTNGIGDMQSINYSVQSMSLSSSAISQTSARTLSRLQQIINQQQQTDLISPSVEHSEKLEPELPTGNQSNNDELFVISTATNTGLQQDVSMPSSSVVSSTRFSTGRSVDDIPEFKPGVPWNPHPNSSQTQTYTNSSSITTPTTPNDFGSLYSDNTGNNDLYSPQGYGRGPGLNLPYGSSHHQPYDAPQPYSNVPQNRFSNPSVGGSMTGAAPYTSYNRVTSYSGPFNGGYNGTVGAGSPGYKNYVTQQKPLGGGFPPGRSYRPKLQQQYSFPGFSSYGPVGGRNSNVYRGQPNSSQQPNKWNFDGNPWGMPATSGSIWSMESDTLLNSTASSNFSEWKGARKPSLPLQLTAPTNYITLKNVSAQIDETSLREVCCEYGKVLSCLMNPFNETVLIQYSTKDEAALAKAGLEKNPSICGVYVLPSYASETEIIAFTEQRTPSNPSVSFTSTLDVTTMPWLHDQHKHVPKKPSTSLWGVSEVDTVASTQSNNSSNSVWSNGSSFSGISTPWNVIGQQQNSTTSRDRDDTNVTSTSPPLSTFLPNGLV